MKGDLYIKIIYKEGVLKNATPNLYYSERDMCVFLLGEGLEK